MWGVLYRLYYKLRKKEIEKAKVRLKKMKIDTILQCLTKECWKYGIQFELIIKTNEYFTISLLGRKKRFLLKYHNSDMVFFEDFNKFVFDVEMSGPSKALYITTGVFEPKIIKQHSGMLFNRRIKIYDNLMFIKSQLGLTDTVELFSKKQLKFFNYLPS